uniref:C-type lectin domain-containing protein n=1 Tax=Sinocyclocheilus grahami TaxID=75366 RepID=A0A672K2F5_SINGR
WGRMSVAFKCRGLRLLLFMYSDDEEVLSCPEHQQAFESSCYEFVALQRSFLSAQAWCERGGGHLSFIQNDETQQFLQKHLQPKQDWWIGLAPASTNLTLDSAEPLLNASCGYIRKDSGFQWETTSNCSQELYFICEFGWSFSSYENPFLIWFSWL